MDQGTLARSNQAKYEDKIISTCSPLYPLILEDRELRPKVRTSEFSGDLLPEFHDEVQIYLKLNIHYINRR
jgi:restriction endonuclease Mrr